MRDTSFDTITYDLIQMYVKILTPLAGLTVGGVTGAVYGHLGLPVPQEPFPAIYCYLGGGSPDYGQGSSIRRDPMSIVLRIIGGPATPSYRFVPEDIVNKLVTAVINELDYRPYLQDPTNNNQPFRYIDPNGTVQVTNVGRSQGFAYGDKGVFVGTEITTRAVLQFNVGRLS